MESLIAASIAFVGSHFLLSHPLRRPIVGAIGEGPFLGLYTLVAFATLGWMAHAFAAAPAQPLWWAPGDLLWGVASAAMLVASVLFVGSLFGNPAFPSPRAGGHERPIGAATGVYAITRHPMMWGFALWAGVHMSVLPTPANAVLTAAILVLALVGAALQDAKKAVLDPRWGDWRARTSFVPFAAQAAGRARWTFGDARALIGGLVLWLVVTWAHAPLGARFAAGIWRWVG